MMGKEVLPKVKTIISQANMEAKQFDDIKIKPEHILLSIINDNDNECVQILKILRVDINDLHEKISDYLRKSDLIPRIVTSNRGKLPLSEETKDILKGVDYECEKLNDTVIDTPHLMLSILSRKTPTTKILMDLGINYKAFKKIIMDKNTEKNAAFDEEDDFQGEPERFKKQKKRSDTKTPVLDNFCRDISKAAEKGLIDPIIGRAKEIKRIAQILSRRKKNNPILIGDPGVGKTSIVEGLALLIKEGNAPRTIAHKKVYSLDLASIVAGTKYRGQFEERMKAILEECRQNPDIILFIDEIHTIIGAGNSSGGLDGSNILKPALARGEIQVIGATTLDESREHIEKDGALTRRFQQVLVDEPTLEETKIILMNIKEQYEKHHRVFYTEEAIDECVKLADRYIMERKMPDKAIDVMDEAGAATNVSVEKPQIIKELEGKKLGIKERKLEVVRQQRYEDAAELRDEEKKIEEQLEKATKDWAVKLDKKTTTVGPEQISEIVSMMSGIPLSKISIQETKKLLNLDKELMGCVIGQSDAVSKVVKAIKRNRVGIKDKNKPIGSFIFLGPTGMGKTLLAKKLAEHVLGDTEALVRVDMSEYMEKHTVSRLIGAPPGYVGYDQGGQLTEKVRRRPHCVILLDEIEKAHEDVFNIFLQILEDGHVTDGLGRKVNFKNTLIIFTSNLGVREIETFGKSMGFQTNSTIANEEAKINSIIDKALKKKFKPEFLNRIDETIIFNTLKVEDLEKIVHNELEKLEARISEMKFKIIIAKPVIDFLVKEGYDEKYGARPLNRAIQRYVEDPIADEVLGGTFKEGDTIKLTLDEVDKKILFKPGKKSK